LDRASCLATVMRGVFAGNIFDLGATQTSQMHQDGQIDFHATLNKLKPRPWLIDDYDAWSQAVNEPGRYQAAAVFVDNAGCDIILGMIPLIRELLKRGIDVLMVANTAPSLNDITRDELEPLIAAVARFDPIIRQALGEYRLRIIGSGNDAPLIDFSQIANTLNDEIQEMGVNLLILEGMGRAIETNLYAKFSCDTLKVAMLKDLGCAQALGGELFDLVLKFEIA